MAREDQNEAFLKTSFLYGGNADYIEALQARYEKDPSSVDAEWQVFFAGLSDDPASVEKSAKGASWEKPNWPLTANGELVSALDGNWGAVEKIVTDKLKGKADSAGSGISQSDLQQATRDSVRALMMIRAYRVRGHLAANLDPLGLDPPKDATELDPASYGFSEADYDRPIFLDFVLGLETSTIREILSILRRTYCGNVGVQYMHISDPAEKA